MVMTGLSCTKVDVEVDGNRGQPGLILIGLPNKAVGEAKERISSALKNCGVRIRSLRTVVNLAPADVKKTSSALELAIAVGLLKMYKLLKSDFDDAIFFGELSLDGEIKSVRGLLPMVLEAKKLGFKKVFFPKKNWPEIMMVKGIELFPLNHLKEIFLFDKGRLEIDFFKSPSLPKNPVSPRPDFSEIVGLDHAKRVLEIAAAGEHNVLLFGSPGVGKSLLAQAFPGILPALNFKEAIEVTKIYSIYGQAKNGLLRERPFRAPHHTISLMGLMGGGQLLNPGEISLAHNGVLFMDEFVEFSRRSIEALRQPMESGEIVISRVKGSVKYPAKFILLAAANPCPCGYRFHQKKPCYCSPWLIERYVSKLSGPMLDRIDLQLKIQTIDSNQLIKNKINPETSKQVKARVIKALAFKEKRQGEKINRDLTIKEIKKMDFITKKAKIALFRSSKKFMFSNRSYLKVIRVARTIADLESSKKVKKRHIAEALLYKFC